MTENFIPEFDPSYEFVLKDTIGHIIDRSLADGSLKIPSCYGTPIRARLADPKHLEAGKISPIRPLEGLRFDFFENANHLLEFQFIVDPMIYWLREDHKDVYFTPKEKGVYQDIKIAPARNEDDLKEPVLKNIHKDEEIMVKAARSIQTPIECDIDFEYSGLPGITGHGYVLYLPNQYKFRRDYDPLVLEKVNALGFGVSLDDRRLPIVLNMANADSTEFYYNLFSEIFAAVIDPYTRKNLRRRIARETAIYFDGLNESGTRCIYVDENSVINDHKLDQMIKKNTDKARYEEELISTALTQAWLWRLREKKGDEAIPGHAIFKFQDSRTKGRDISRTCDFIQDNGVQRMIDLYSDHRKWDLDKFLNRELR